MIQPMLAAAVADPDAATATAVLFYACAAMAGLAAIGVVLSRNIVRTAVCLLFTLMGLAGLYFLLNSEFLAAVQLVVYAGGTLILIIFGVMLTSKSPFSRFEPKMTEIVVAVSVALLIFGALVMAITHVTWPVSPAPTDALYSVDALGQALLGDYLVPFELSSVLLLLVMIGAAYLAKGRRHDAEPAGGPAGEAAANASRRARQWS
jgi:NADH-quinone oxidoreductase subunit J